MEKLLSRLFDYTDGLEFRSSHSVEETRSALRMIIGKTFADGASARIFKRKFGGHVSNDVVLYLGHNYVGNYTVRPIFYGSLIATNHGSILQGKFSTSRVTKGIFAASIAILALLEFWILYSANTSEGDLAAKYIVSLFIPMAAALGLCSHLIAKRFF
jgi:hypothetical protein